MSANEEKLRQVVKELQTEVGKNRERITKNAKEGTAAFAMFIDAGPKEVAKDIGLIIDDKYNVKDLFAARKINPKDGLRWIHIKSYDEFESFLANRGIPGYVSFDSDLGTKGKDGMACAKLLIKHCTLNKVKLPIWECHSPIVTAKEAIELELYAY